MAVQTIADDVRVTLKVVDMDPSMAAEAQLVARKVLLSGGRVKEKDVATAIKKHFDEAHGPAWHCVVGKNFGSYVTHETNRFLYFYVENMAVLLFKSA